MSRSRKKLPITGITTARSDKRYKQAEHSRERAAVRTALAHQEEAPSPRLFGNPAGGKKDGKMFNPALPTVYRK